MFECTILMCWSRVSNKCSMYWDGHQKVGKCVRCCNWIKNWAESRTELNQELSWIKNWAESRTIWTRDKDKRIGHLPVCVCLLVSIVLVFVICYCYCLLSVHCLFTCLYCLCQHLYLVWLIVCLLFMYSPW